ncbi:MAG TPA: tyrosine-type recombinase/integrase [Candidatus Olsenella excrementavium]|uniref:Tyrosine-type recombinase/integrase n=1 Tax=Candidatus Olsenella excrementavium TaxID=2838709 RepID=A0A9D1ZAR0_9ACTN|nr:tyrosine-type recombinase/integrase [Candidatus Olsenella excrementavium]
MGYDFHELRHRQATFLIGSGIDPKSVQGRLGHEVSSMTMDATPTPSAGTTARPPTSWAGC